MPDDVTMQDGFGAVPSSAARTILAGPADPLPTLTAETMPTVRAETRAYYEAGVQRALAKSQVQSV